MEYLDVNEFLGVDDCEEVIVMKDVGDADNVYEADIDGTNVALGIEVIHPL
jgi:hypothetical protein